MTNKIETRIFFGYFQNSDIKGQLQQSATWRSSVDLKDFELKQISHKDKEYIGLFVSAPIDFQSLKDKEALIRKTMLFYCPSLNFDKYSLYLFPQTFVS